MLTVKTEFGVSKNEKYADRGSKRHSKKWNEYKLLARNDAKGRKKLKGDLGAWLFVPKNNRRDVHNFIEFFLDAFEGKWYENDKQIKLVICQEYLGKKFDFSVWKTMDKSKYSKLMKGFSDNKVYING